MFYLYCSYVWIYKSIFGCDHLQNVNDFPNYINNLPQYEKYLFIETRKEYARKLDALTNSAIEPELYDAVQYEKLLQIENSDIENKWKSSILFDFIPGGSVIMFYDIFRHSFAYYSDSVVSSELLNMVALKYVTTFHCKDFFVDTSDLKVDEDVYNFQSPLIKVFEEYEKLATTAPSTIPAYEPNEMNDAQTNRLKKIRENMKTVAKTVNKNSSIAASKKKENIVKHINKFIYMGKIANFSFLKKNDIENTTEMFDTIFTLTSELQEQSKFMRGIKIIQPPTNKLVDTKKTWKDFCEEKRKSQPTIDSEELPTELTV